MINKEKMVVGFVGSKLEERLKSLGVGDVGGFADGEVYKAYGMMLAVEPENPERLNEVRWSMGINREKYNFRLWKAVDSTGIAIFEMEDDKGNRRVMLNVTSLTMDDEGLIRIVAYDDEAIPSTADIS